MDIRDFLNPAKAKFPFMGSYYESKQEEELKKGGLRFRYKHENPNSATYRKLFSNVLGAEAKDAAIRTNTQLNFKANSIVILQDGTAYRISEMLKDYNSAPQEVFRISNHSAAIEYVLRLTEYENPFDIK